MALGTAQTVLNTTRKDIAQGYATGSRIDRGPKDKAIAIHCLSWTLQHDKQMQGYMRDKMAETLQNLQEKIDKRTDV